MHVLLKRETSDTCQICAWHQITANEIKIKHKSAKNNLFFLFLLNGNKEPRQNP